VDVMAGSLGARALSGFTWSGLGAVATVGFQLLFTAALARLLSPADFGLMAMAMVALRFFSYFSQLGLGAALVQKEALSEADVRTALGLTWLVCLGGAALVALAAPLLGLLFQDPAVVPLVRALSLNLILVGLGTVSMALLRRQLRYRAITAIETASYALGYGLLGVALAWAGLGVWTLVVTTFAQAAIQLGAAWALTRHPLRPSLAGDRRALLAYGAPYTAVGFLEFLAASLDTAVVGRLLGGATLGVYNRAAMLTHQPVVHAGGVMTRVLFPLLATVQKDLARTGGVWLLGLAGSGVLGGAVAYGLSGAAADVVRVLLGPAFAEAAPVVRVLALATPLLLMAQVCSVACDAQALLRFKLTAQVLHLALLAALLLALRPWGLAGMAWGVVGAEVLRFGLYVGFLTRRLACPPGEVARVLLGVALTAALAWLGCAGAMAAGARLGLPPAAALGLDVLAGLLALGAGVLALLRLLEGTGPARFADAAVPGWQRLRARLGLARG
jgi:O-antigen/teichoic acid export membrane protein